MIIFKIRISLIHYIYFYDILRYSRIFTVNAALDKYNRNLSLTPVKKPEYLYPLNLYISWNAPTYELEGLTFSKWVLTQSNGIITIVLINATIADAGNNIWNGIASLSYNFKYFRNNYLTKWSHYKNKDQFINYLKNKGPNPLNIYYILFWFYLKLFANVLN